MAKPTIPLRPDKTYHIWTHANGSENIFRIDENSRYFLQKYSLYIFPIADTFAYCLMPNHLHLMVRFKPAEEIAPVVELKKSTIEVTPNSIQKFLSSQFSHLLNGYTQAYNNMFDRRGSLFIPNFERKVVESKTYYTRLITYIHLNPIHHGFVSNLNDWLHSSWHSYSSSKPTQLRREEASEWFGDKGLFTQMHEEFLKEDVWRDFDFN